MSFVLREGFCSGVNDTSNSKILFEAMRPTLAPHSRSAALRGLRACVAVQASGASGRAGVAHPFSHSPKKFKKTQDEAGKEAKQAITQKFYYDNVTLIFQHVRVQCDI